MWSRLCRGQVSLTRRLLDFVGIHTLASMADLVAMLDAQLPGLVTTQDIAWAMNSSRRLGQPAAFCFREADVSEICASDGNALRYRRESRPPVTRTDRRQTLVNTRTMGMRMQINGPTTAGLMYSDTGGDGPVIVLLHGVLMNQTLWAEVVDGLRDRYRCIVPVLPFGAHETPMPPDADLSLNAIATMLAEFLVELELHNVTLVCNDWGGAQLVISPGGSDRVANLVLVSCEAFDNYPPGLPGRLLCLNAILPGGTFLSVQLLRPSWIRHLPFTFGALSKGRVPNDQFLSWIHPARHNRMVRRDLTKYLRHVPNKNLLLQWAEQQRSFRGPTLIVWAREDKLMPPAHAERLAAHFENSQLVWIDDSRTLIPIDQPAILTEHLRAFLAEHAS